MRPRGTSRAAGLVLAALLAGCVPNSRRPEPAAPPPAPAGQWPEERRIQKLPPAATLPKRGPVKPRTRPRPSPPAVAVPAPPPAWEARKAADSAVEVKASSYTVATGDNLGRIADKTGAGIEAIARANGLAPPYPVRIGQRLAIPAGRYHRVQRGQSGIAIARAYGVEWSRIVDLNQLQPPYMLREGERLLIPGKAEVASMSMEERAAAFRLDIDDLITGAEPAATAKAPPAKPVTSPRKPPAPTVPVAEPAVFAGRFAWPLRGRILRPFGTIGDGRRNDGINIAADKGTPVVAAADGVVAYAGNGIAIFGGLILIRHGDGWITAYGNCGALLVARGQAVKKGQTIAKSGDTGYVTEPQLHFEVRQGRRPVNPVTMLP
jgi:murein DD-endopeptidase MepM/ murein hydrolase activator NlpD